MNASVERSTVLRHALRLEYLTVGWNVVEGIVAISAALLAGSVALFGFGVHSFVESASGGVLVWRLLAERSGGAGEDVERLERRALRIVGATLLLLAAYVAIDALATLWHAERPRPTPVGIALTAVSIVVMQWLARAKRRTAAALGSRALEADAFQTTACFWLSIVTLAGIGLNGAFGWWWADPIAALAITGLVAKEGRDAWTGEAECGCRSSGATTDCSKGTAPSVASSD